MPDKKERSKKANNIRQYWFVIRQLAAKEIKHGNASKHLGQVWNIIMPFVQMLTMAILFGFVFKRDIKEFMPYVFTGTIVYGFFDGVMSGCLGSLSSSKNLLIRTKIPANVFPLEKVYVALIRILFSLVGYVIILIATGTAVGVIAIMSPIGIVFSAFISLGIGKILSVINVYFADISYFYKIIMRFVFFGSAIFYQVDKASPIMQKVIGYNPVYLAIHFERYCILYNQCPELSVWVKLTLFAAVIYLIGTIVFKKGTQDVVAKL